MRSVIQRVLDAKVSVNGNIVGEIKKGLLVFFAVHIDDTEAMIEKMADKILKLRIFEDDNSKMNLSLVDLGLEVLIVSQFTLYGDTKKGNRPSFIESAKPEKAIPFYEKLISRLNEKNIKVRTGEFGAEMVVEITNNGPATIIIDL